MYIMIMTTPNNMAAVERFSKPMSPTMGSVMARMYLKATLSAPFSRCMALSIWASASMSAPLAISDGWNVKPGISMTRLAPLMVSPPTRTHSSVTIEMSNRKGVISLKYLQGMFSVTTAMNSPMAMVPVCFRMGEMKF